MEIFGPCASLSLLGHNIRGILHELGSAFELFQDHKVYLVSQAANDLNFTFVIDEAQGDRLVQQLHERLIQSIGSDKVLGPTWLQLFAPKETAAPAAVELVGGARASGGGCSRSPARIGGVRLRPREPRCRRRGAARGASRSSRWAYAMKANWHPEILRRVHAAGLTIECVSQGEIEHAFAHVPGLDARARAVHAEFRAALRVRVRLPPRRARHPR